MGLTQNSQIFLGIKEHALNQAIGALCDQRPRLLHYGSPAWVSATTSQETQVTPLSVAVFPSVTVTVQWKMDLSQPQADIHPANASWPPPLSFITPNHFGIHIATGTFVVGSPPGVTFSTGVLLLGHALLVPVPGGHLIKMALDSVAMPGSPLPPATQAALDLVLPGLLAPFIGQIQVRLPNLGIGPVIPAGPPVAVGHQFELRGDL